MKFAVASEHREFFNKNGYIQFADVLTPEQLQGLSRDLKQALVNRLQLASHYELERLSTANVFLKGRDLWRELPAIRKTISSPSLLDMAWEFLQVKPLRIGDDQYLPRSSRISTVVGKPTLYEQLLAVQASLSEISSIQGTVCGWLLCINSEAKEESVGVVPSTPGHGVFFSADYPIPFDQLDPNSDFFMITYALQKSVYIHNENDCLGTLFREQGCNYGDKLTDKLNPIVLR